jgi:hypothetical protein
MLVEASNKMWRAMVGGGDVAYYPAGRFLPPSLESQARKAPPLSTAPTSDAPSESPPMSPSMHPSAGPSIAALEERIWQLEGIVVELLEERRKASAMPAQVPPKGGRTQEPPRERAILDAIVIRRPGSALKSSCLYDGYAKSCLSAPISRQKFYRLAKARFGPTTKKKDGNYYIGLTLCRSVQNHHT